MNHFPPFFRGPDPRTPFPTARAPRPDMPRVEVLLALFEGERFLGEQLESLARQTYRAWSLAIRDDGSRDRGPAIAQGFAATMPGRGLRLLEGPHLGRARGFLALVLASDPMADYLAFCDQDDVWDPGKLARAVDRLAALPAGVPALYCGPALRTGAAPRPTGRSPRGSGAPSFRNALVECVAGGNTMVMNRAAAGTLRLAAGFRGPIPAHDWWAYQVVTGAGGIVVHDDRPMVFSRRHAAPRDASAAGAPARLRALAGGQFRSWCDQNVAALTAISPLLTPRRRALLREFAELRAAPLAARLRRLVASGIHCQTRGGQAALLAAAAAGRI